MTAISELEKALAAKPSTLTLLTVVLLAYAVLELVEGVGLWLLKRWGEYFAVVATAVFVPLEVYDLTKGLTLTRVLTFTINIAAVVYLLVSKRLFGLRGGRQAYDDERRGEQLLEVERAATTVLSGPRKFASVHTIRNEWSEGMCHIRIQAFRSAHGSRISSCASRTDIGCIRFSNSGTESLAVLMCLQLLSSIAWVHRCLWSSRPDS